MYSARYCAVPDAQKSSGFFQSWIIEGQPQALWFLNNIPISYQFETPTTFYHSVPCQGLVSQGVLLRQHGFRLREARQRQSSSEHPTVAP